MKNTNKLLIFSGSLSVIAALLHLAIIMGGPQWYRFFGAGEKMASLAEQGSWRPAAVTFAIAVILFIWGLYAFSGAGLTRRLPLLKTGLVVISGIYLVRGLALIPVYFLKPHAVDAFLVWSSLICMVFGFSHVIGTKQAWGRLSGNERRSPP